MQISRAQISTSNVARSFRESRESRDRMQRETNKHDLWSYTM